MNAELCPTSVHGGKRPGPTLWLLLCCSLFLLTSSYPTTAQPLLGYTDRIVLEDMLQSLGASDNAELSSIATTAGGQKIHLLTVSRGEPSGKPAIVITAGALASHRMGTELCLRMARKLIAALEALPAGSSDPLARYTFYFLPQLNPDAAAAQAAAPAWERSVNLRPADDDDDYVTDEDGPEDLNGDGLITMLRVLDPKGGWRVHPEDPRLMIEADEKKNEEGAWLHYPEGIDNDGDERWGEDGPGGVDFNRNFTFRYPYFAPGAGPNQVSEPETRAVADFLFDHPEIALVLSFTPQDNLMTPWKPQQGPNQDGQHSSIDAGDEPYFKYLSEQYRKLRETAKLDNAAPPPPAGEGSFSEWAYYHYGRWSIAMAGWWVPELKDDKKPADAATAEAARTDAAAATDSTAPVAAEAAQPAAEEKKPEEKKEDLGERGKQDLRAIRWFDAQGIDAFVEWTPVQHPDFPGQTVEVGGFAPYLRSNPPASELDALASLHYDWLTQLTLLMPRLAIDECRVEELGAGVYRLTATVRNDGYLPTSPAMGEIISQSYPLQAELTLPAGSELISGEQRRRMPRLAGNGATAELVWLLRMPAPGRIGLRVWAPAVGEAGAAASFANSSWSVSTWPQ